MKISQIYSELNNIKKAMVGIATVPTINETLNKLTNAINSLENAIITNLKKGDN